MNIKECCLQLMSRRLETESRVPASNSKNKLIILGQFGGNLQITFYTFYSAARKATRLQLKSLLWSSDWISREEDCVNLSWSLCLLHPDNKTICSRHMPSNNIFPCKFCWKFINLTYSKKIMFKHCNALQANVILCWLQMT